MSGAGTYEVVWYLPEECRGKVIGKKGCNIRKLEELELIVTLPKVKTETTIAFSGSKSALRAGKNLLRLWFGFEMFEAKNANCAEIDIPRKERAHIVGKGGENLAYLQRKFRAFIIIPREDKPCRVIGGSIEGVRRALDALRRLAQPDEEGTRERRVADGHFQKRNKFFEEASAAFQRGEKAEAKHLSELGHKEDELGKQAHARASKIVFQYHNVDESCLDLHGQRVDEALRIVDDYLKRGKFPLEIITGRGLHSEGGKAKVRPAVVDFLREKKYNVNDSEPGVLIVSRQGEICAIQ